MIELLSRYAVELRAVNDGDPIDGSYWGDPEAGVIGQKVYVRSDTPVHSLLHELAHIVCMTSARRSALHRDAGGDDLEESAVCYLQIVLADYLPKVGRDRLMRDMDAWGYSFRVGSTAAWFVGDADDAVTFLAEHGILAANGTPTWRLRDE